MTDITGEKYLMSEAAKSNSFSNIVKLSEGGI